MQEKSGEWINAALLRQISTLVGCKSKSFCNFLYITFKNK